MPEGSASIEVQLAVINTKLDTLLVQRDDHETRIRKLERMVWMAAAAAVAGGGAAGAIARFVFGG